MTKCRLLVTCSKCEKEFEPPVGNDAKIAELYLAGMNADPRIKPICDPCATKG